MNLKEKGYLLRIHVVDEIPSATQSHHGNVANPAPSLSHAADEAPIAESLDDPHTTPVRVTIVIYGCRDADLPQNTGDLKESALLSIQDVPVPVVSSQISRDLYSGNG